MVEQHTATIWSFPNQRLTSDKRLFLKLPDPIHRGNEEGLLGLAFHPKYKDNREFFVYYSANDGGRRRSVVSRFQRRATIRGKPNPPARSESGCRRMTRSRTTTAARSPSGRTATFTSPWEIVAPPMIPSRPVRTQRIGSPRFYGSTSIIQRPEKPMEYQPIIRPCATVDLHTGHRRCTASDYETSGSSASTGRPATYGPAMSGRTSGKWST